MGKFANAAMPTVLRYAQFGFVGVLHAQAIARNA
jgi:hypothetical protein